MQMNHRGIPRVIIILCGFFLGSQTVQAFLAQSPKNNNNVRANVPPISFRSRPAFLQTRIAAIPRDDDSSFLGNGVESSFSIDYQRQRNALLQELVQTRALRQFQVEPLGDDTKKMLVPFEEDVPNKNNNSEEEACGEEGCEINWDDMEASFAESTQYGTGEETGVNGESIPGDSSSEEDDCGEEGCEINWDDMEASFERKEVVNGERITGEESVEEDCGEEGCEINWDMMPGAPSKELEPSCSTKESHDQYFWNDLNDFVQRKLKEPQPQSTKVDLLLNPEVNTGYDGAHVWANMYQAIHKPQASFLYRLVSGMHTSTTLSIGKRYHAPSKRKSREDWESNLKYFQSKFQEDTAATTYLNNLDFSYRVILQALETTALTGERLSVFLAPLKQASDDEEVSQIQNKIQEILSIRQNVLRKDSSLDQDLWLIKQDKTSFKEQFYAVSTLLDTVKCQQCRLHGKISMLGYGAALKILLFYHGDDDDDDDKVETLSLEQNEVVAFLHTLARFSQSLQEYQEMNQELQRDNHSFAPTTSFADSDLKSPELLDRTVGTIARLANSGAITEKEENQLINHALRRSPELMVLTKYYGNNLTKYARFAKAWAKNKKNELSLPNDSPDAIIVGSGLAGLVTALQILDRGGTVTIIEKESTIGGNSNKASSGINAVNTETNALTEGVSPDLEAFYQDTLQSAGASARPDLIKVLIENSDAAVSWLQDRARVDLSRLAQLGGHSTRRTHRPTTGMVGAEIIYGVRKALKKYEKTNKANVLLGTRVEELLQDDKASVVGVKCRGSDGKVQNIHSKNTILATGGFAADRTRDSLLAKYRPELLNMGATAGKFSTGDGVNLASALGAATVDMDKVQIHPTGWVDPNDTENPNKILAAEVLRGVGGLLFNATGHRFCNEIGTRSYVADKMLCHDHHYKQSGIWWRESTIPTFSLVLSEESASECQNLVDRYEQKGIMQKVEGVQTLAAFIGADLENICNTLFEYQQSASSGVDQFGKTVFSGVPCIDREDCVFYVGTVAPVLHYCMGGIAIDNQGNVLLEESNDPIQGLHAVGEVTGGVHGDNRLAGNSLLECTVFGMMIGNNVPIEPKQEQSGDSLDIQPDLEGGKVNGADRVVTLEELQQHNRDNDCWVAIDGTVYDLTDFAEDHPAGAESIIKLAGSDGSAEFNTIHSKAMLEEFEEDKVGILEYAVEKMPASTTGSG